MGCFDVAYIALQAKIAGYLFDRFAARERVDPNTLLQLEKSQSAQFRGKRLPAGSGRLGDVIKDQSPRMVPLRLTGHTKVIELYCCQPPPAFLGNFEAVLVFALEQALGFHVADDAARLPLTATLVHVV